MTMVSESMPRKPSENTTQIALRVPDAWLERCDSLIPWITRPGINMTRTDIMRAALARGLDALESERSKEKKPVGSVFVDIESPRPARTWDRCLDAASKGKKPPLSGLLPWARGAIASAVTDWLRLGNDPAYLQVEVTVLYEDDGAPDASAPDVHAHRGERHDPARFPAVFVMRHVDFGGFEEELLLALNDVAK